MNGYFMPVRRTALFSAVSAAWSQFLDGPPADRPAHRTRTLAQLPLALDAGPQSQQAYTLTVVALSVNAPHPLMWLALSGLERVAPRHNQLPWLKARVYLETGAYGQAIQLAETALSVGPTLEKWPDLLAAAQNRLRQQLPK